MPTHYNVLPVGYVIEKKKPATLLTILMFVILTPFLLYVAAKNPYKFVMFVIGLVINIPLSIIHENCHKLGFILFSEGANAEVVPMKWLKNPHCKASGYFKGSVIVPTLLLPLVIISLTFLVSMIFTAGIVRDICAGCFMCHFVCCASDIFDCFWVLSKPKTTLFAVTDTITAYKKEDRPI